MATLKYKVITSKARYKAYCQQLEQLVFSGLKDRDTKDEIALLTVLIQKWDAEHSTLIELDPVQLLYSFMNDHDLKAKDLVAIAGISKGYVSDILRYKKGFSKEVTRKLATYFKVSQEAFNRPYPLQLPGNTPSRNTKKALATG